MANQEKKTKNSGEYWVKKTNNDAHDHTVNDDRYPANGISKPSNLIIHIGRNVTKPISHR